MPNIKKALAVEGWMERPELQWLAEQASQHKIIAEIGSYKGRSTRALADNTSGLVVAIDDFYGPREIELAGRDTILSQFQSNLSGCSNVVVINCNHRQLPTPDFRPDMVFIDGAHEYEAVKADIRFWFEHIAPGGLLCGHDYGWSPGVNQAVDEAFPLAKKAPGTSIWYQTIVRPTKSEWEQIMQFHLPG